MATLAELRGQAKGMGISPAIIRACDTPEQLQSIIAGFGSSDDAPAKPRKKASATASARKKSSGNSARKSASSKSVPAAKSKTGKAKRPTTAKAQATGTDGPSGRNLLNGVDFSMTDGWNPRDGSPPDRIIRALKRAKGNRAKVFDNLVGEIWEFVGKKKADGSKRSKAEAEDMLRYRISRTAFDFAVRTGQHDVSTNRAAYGTGGTGEGVFKRKTKAQSKSKTTPAKASGRKQARKTASKAKTTNRKKAGSKK